MSAASSAYTERAEEYVQLLGTIDAMAPTDRRTITEWAAEVDGPLLDLGCGPAHWTAHLADLGHEVIGVDPSAGFLASARRRFPALDLREGSAEDLPLAPGSCGGVLAWYSLIHHDPEELPAALASCARTLRPGGRLLLGFFEGEGPARFDHAVHPAWRWPMETLVPLLVAAGFRVTSTQRRHDPGARPHGQIEAALPR